MFDVRDHEATPGGPQPVTDTLIDGVRLELIAVSFEAAAEIPDDGCAVVSVPQENGTYSVLLVHARRAPR